MAFCNNCGVTFKDTSKCPLCGLVPANEQSSGFRAYPEKNVPLRQLLHHNQGLKINWWGAISILSLAPMLLIISIDIIFSKTISWSVFTIISLLSLWLYGTAIFFTNKLPFFRVLTTFIITFLLVFFMDLADGSIRWFFHLGMPAVIGLYFNIVWICLASWKSRKGFNIVAYVLFAIILQCLITDATVHAFIEHVLYISWSIVILAFLLPIGGFFLYLHFILRKTLDIRKLFHM